MAQQRPSVGAEFPTPKGEFELIDDLSQIQAQIQRLVQHRSFVTVFLPHSRTPCNSTILELELKENRFLLDQLFPPQGDKLLRQQGRLRLFAKSPGSMLYFDCLLDETAELGGFAHYRMAVPTQLHYFQRRDVHRVELDEKARIEAVLQLEGGGELSGIVRDLSAGGCGLLLAEGQGGGVTAGESRHLCRMTLPSGELLELPVILRSLRAVGQQQLAGLQFTDLPSRQAQQLARVVVSQERQQARRRHTHE